MKIYSVSIENFRGIRSGKLRLSDHAVLIGGQQHGKILAVGDVSWR